MNTNVRFYRVVVAAALGAVLWAACSSPQHETPAPYTPYAHASAPAPGPRPMNLLRYTPDTHPEYRVGLSSFATQPFENVLPAGGANPILHVVQRDWMGQGVIISEPAGAQPNAEQLQEYKKQLGDRAAQGDP